MELDQTLPRMRRAGRCSPLLLAHYEWTRIRTLRSTWLIAAAALLLTAVVSVLLGYSATHRGAVGR